MNIVACMPMYKSMDVQAVQSLIQMQSDIYKNGDSLEILTTTGVNLYYKRNLLLKSALKKEPDWILSIDSDHVYSSHIMYELIKNDKDIVAAKYYVNGGVGMENRPLAMGRWNDGKFEQVVPKENDSGLIEVDVVGFGFTLIKPSALKKMYDDGDSFMTPTGSINKTDDVLFCDQARKCGTKIYYNADFTIGHLSLTTSI